MLYTGDPRRLLKPTDVGHQFVVQTTSPPVSVQHDLLQSILTVYLDPFEAPRSPSCPLCYAPVHRVRLFDVETYERLEPENGRRLWELIAIPRAVEFSPCPHVIAPYDHYWWHRYNWPGPFLSNGLPLRRESWGRPIIAITEQEPPA